MSVELFDASRIQAEQAARRQRTEELRLAFDEISLLVVNTGTHAKATPPRQMAAIFFDPRFAHDDTKTLISPSKKDEPILPRAHQVAQFKAETARHEYVEQKFSDLHFLLQQLDLALHHNLSDAVLRKLLAGIVFLGADTNAFTTNPKTGLLEPSHKLERKFGNNLPEEEFVKLRKELYETYVFPPSGRSRVVWDISTMTINGTNHEFTDLVEVISKPIAAEILEIYLAQALADGKILRSNTHLALFEMLEESGAIISTSRLPGSLQKQGYTFEAFRQSPKPGELQAIKHSIPTNAPVYVA